jgi:hypothetical protein
MSSIYLIILYFVLSWSTSAILHKNHSISNKYRNQNINKLLFLTLPPILLGFYFIALRPFSSGGDTSAYISAFTKIDNPLTATSDADYGTELLFWPTQAIFKLVFDVRGWLIVNYLIVVAITYLSYKRTTEGTKISPLIFSLTLLTFFAVYSGNAMRQVYSIPLGMIAFHYCYKKDNIKFLIFSALAASYHWSSLVILASPLIIALPNKRLYYIAVPALALACSSLIGPIIDFVTDLTGFSWLLSKSDLYLKGGRISHIEAIWKTVNFWLCVCVYLALIITNAVTDKSNQKIAKFLLMFFSLMLFAVANTDVSERYMVWYLFAIPLAVTIIFSKFKIMPIIKNQLYLALFLIMAVLVYTRESAMLTLGITQ